MSLELKQFVPSSVCLKCDGCCRFQSADSAWRPRWDKREFTDDNHYVTAIADCGKYLCRFLNKSDSTCRVYSDRPFECALYPFLLSKQGNGVKVYVHLACPYIQITEQSPEFKVYVDYLKSFFHEQGTLNFLKRNRHLISDYAPFEGEMLNVFTIQDAL